MAKTYRYVQNSCGSKKQTITVVEVALWK